MDLDAAGCCEDCSNIIESICVVIDDRLSEQLKHFYSCLEAEFAC